jgi:cytochrome P450
LINVQVLPIWHKMFGKGLFMVYGDQWKRQHRIVARSFGPTNTRGFLPTVRAVAERHVNKLWQPRNDDGGETTITPCDAFGPMTLEVICSIAFGLESQTVLARLTELTAIVTDIMNSHGLMMMIPGYLWLPTTLNRRILGAIDEGHELCRALVQRHRDGADARKKSGDDGEAAR